MGLPSSSQACLLPILWSFRRPFEGRGPLGGMFYAWLSWHSTSWAAAGRLLAEFMLAPAFALPGRDLYRVLAPSALSLRTPCLWFPWPPFFMTLSFHFQVPILSWLLYLAGIETHFAPSPYGKVAPLLRILTFTWRLTQEFRQDWKQEAEIKLKETGLP